MASVKQAAEGSGTEAKPEPKKRASLRPLKTLEIATEESENLFASARAELNH